MRPHRLWSVVVLFVCSCVGGSKVKGTGHGDGGVAAIATAGSATTGKGGRQGGGYIVVTSPEPRALNPVTQAAFDVVTPLVFEGLVGLDARSEPVPVLAERWERSADGKVLTFTLRKGVKWHDGKPFSSADVVFTAEAIRKGGVPFAAYLASVEAVAAPDASTVTVRYREPYGPDVASFVFGVLPRHHFEGQELTSAPANAAPVGTGPFKFTRWSPKKNIVLSANEEYWAGRPMVDQLEAVFDIRPRDHLRALRENKIDFAEITEPSDWTGALRTPEFLEEFESGVLDENVLTLIAWNCQKPPLDDRRVRQALTMALDRPRIIEDVLNGAARPVSGPFFPTLWGADPNIAPWPFDVARGNALLDEARRPKKGEHRFAVELLVQDSFRGSAPYDGMLAIFRTDMDKIGVDLVVHYLPRGDLVERLILHNFDAVLFRWTSDIADPDPYALLHSSQVNGGENYVGYVNADVDRLLEEGRRAQDRAKRKESYFALHRVVHEEQPYTFLFAPQRYYAWSRRVRGVSPLDLSALPRWPGVARWSVR